MTPEELCDAGIEAYNASKYEVAFDYFRQAAEQGYTDAEYQLGLCYLDGEGVGEDEQVAYRWLQKAADKGHMEAQYEIGQYYDFQYDTEEALKWYKKSADQGHIDGAYWTAMIYKSHGKPIDYELAMEYFMKVANSGEDPFDYHIEDSMREIGWLYYFGDGVEKDDYQALLWFKKSVEQIIQGPRIKHWTEKVKSFINPCSNMWQRLQEHIDDKGNIIEPK